MTNQELELRLKEKGFKILGKVTIYRKTEDGWTDSVVVSNDFVTNYNFSSDRSFGAERADLEFVNAEQLFWTNRDSPYNKISVSKETWHSFGDSRFLDFELNGVVKDLIGVYGVDGLYDGYCLNVRTKIDNDGNAIYTVPSEGVIKFYIEKTSAEKWGMARIDGRCLGDYFSSINVDLAFSDTKLGLGTSVNRINDILYISSRGSSSMGEYIPPRFNEYNFCQVTIRLQSPNAPYSHALVEDFKMSIFSGAKEEKYSPLVYWNNRIKIDEIILFPDGARKSYTRFYGIIKDVPPEFSINNRGTINISALDMMKVLNSEIFESPRRDRKTVYSDGRALNMNILEPKRISTYGYNDSDIDENGYLNLTRLNTSNDLVPINESDVGYVFSVPLKYRNNPTVTNVGSTTKKYEKSFYQEIKAVYIEESQTFQANTGKHYFVPPEWWLGHDVILEGQGATSYYYDDPDLPPGQAPSFIYFPISATVNSTEYSISDPYSKNLGLCQNKYNIEVISEDGYNTGYINLKTTADRPIDVPNKIRVEDIVFSSGFVVPEGANSVIIDFTYKFNTSSSSAYLEIDFVLGGETSLDGKVIRANSGKQRFLVTKEDWGKTITASATNISILGTYWDDFQGGILDGKWTCEFDVPSISSSTGNGDRKFINWAKVPQPVVIGDGKKFTEQDGMQIDYARGVVYMPQECKEVKARFDWYDMDTNRFEEVVASLIMDAFYAVEGYSPKDWILVDENGEASTLSAEYDNRKPYKRDVPLTYVYAPNGIKSNLRIELKKSYPRATIPRVVYEIKDKKTHFQVIKDLLDQRYVNPSYRVYVDASTIYDENGIEQYVDIVYKGDYQYQKEEAEANVLFYENIKYPLESEKIYSKVVAFGVRPTVPNVALDAKVLEFNAFPGAKEMINESRRKKENIKKEMIIDGDIKGAYNFYGHWTYSEDAQELLPADIIKIELREPIRLGRVDILWGKSGSNKNIDGFGGRIYASEDGGNWYTLKSDGGDVRGSSGQWSSVSEDQFDPAIRLLNVKYIKIEATSLASYPTGLIYNPTAYCWSVREIQIFPSDIIRVETTINDIVGDVSDEHKSVISQETANRIRSMVGEKTLVLPIKDNLMTEKMVKARSMDTLYEVCRLLYRAEVSAIYLPHIKVGMTVRLNDKISGVDTLYMVESLSGRKDGKEISCALSLVRWA